MSLNWSAWSSPAQGNTLAGTPITAIPISNAPGQFALFIADPGGYIYTASGNNQVGWGDWSWVAQGHAAPGSQITALPLTTAPGEFVLFIASPAGEVMTTSGSAQKGWAPWANVAEGSTSPRQLITAVPVATSLGQYALFIADPNGYIYTATGNAQIGWGDWTWVAQGQAAPGSPVTALPLAASPAQYILFIASPSGEVLTTSGSAQSGWTAWSSVAQGSTAPGQLITAIPLAGAAGEYALFTTDPNGYTYWIAGNVHGWGDWNWIAEGQAAPKTPVTAVYLPLSEGSQLELFVTKTDGQIYMTSNPTSWAPWTAVPGSSAKSGSLITAVALQPDLLALFVAGAEGGVYTASMINAVPVAPTNLHLVSVEIDQGDAAQSLINIGWTDNSTDETGFTVTATADGGLAYKATVAANTTTYQIVAKNGYTYSIIVAAVNAAGSAPSNAISVPVSGNTTPPTSEASISAFVTDATNVGVYTLAITGSNFGKSEQVEVTVNWIVSGEGAGNPYALPPVMTDPLVGSFSTTFSGNSTGGFCPIEEPLGTPQPLQTFKVTAKGLTSSKTASATTTFTCPFSANTLIAQETN
jgi:hypothetical protein